MKAAELVEITENDKKLFILLLLKCGRNLCLRRLIKKMGFDV